MILKFRISDRRVGLEKKSLKKVRIEVEQFRKKVDKISLIKHVYTRHFCVTAINTTTKNYENGLKKIS